MSFPVCRLPGMPVAGMPATGSFAGDAVMIVFSNP